MSDRPPIIYVTGSVEATQWSDGDCIWSSESTWADETRYIRDDVAEQRIAELEAGIRAALDTVTEEINPSNYDHDTVCRISSEWVEAELILDALLNDKESDND